MAESNPEDTWWGWLQTAKEKVVTQSSEVLEFVKNDIDEFTKVVSEETSTIVSSTASALKTKLKLDEEDSTANNVKKQVGGFLSHVAEVFTPPPDDGDEEAFVISNNQPVMLSRLEAGIYSELKEEKVFLEEPSNEADYAKWLETFDMDSKQVEMADLLVSIKPLHKHFTNLVPTKVSHSLFWHRYFYLVHTLEQKEEKRKALSSRVSEAAKEDLDKGMVWEDDDVLTSDVDIPEEVQTKLLQEYEEELLSSTSSSSEKLEELDSEKCEVKTTKPKQKAKKSVAVEQPKSILEKSSAAKKDESKAPTKTDVSKAKSAKAKAATTPVKSKGKKSLAKATSPSPSSAETSPVKSIASDTTNEDDWEKLDAEESDSGIVETPQSEEGGKKKEDWEDWQ